MRQIFWTRRARADLAGIRAYVARDSPHLAEVVIARLLVAVDRLVQFPESGRPVPEFPESELREVIHPPYRLVYRLVERSQVHILTVHHGARRLPSTL